MRHLPLLDTHILHARILSHCTAVTVNRHIFHDMEDMGILISTDPIAIDQACLDLVYASDDPGRDHLLERIESRHGVHTIEAAAALGFGTREYELITVA